MRTETELRAAIDELAHDAPDVDALLSGVPPARRRRGRMLAPIAVAAAVAAAAISVAMLTGTDGTHSQVGDTGPVATFAHPCATTSTPDFRTLTIGPVAGLASTPVTETSCAGYRQRWLYDTNGGWVGEVTVYAPGVFGAALTRNARQVSGSGITGYEVTIPGAAALGVVPCDADPKTGACADLSGLAWQYGDNAWALLTTLQGDATTRLLGSDPTAKELEIAAAVDTSAGAKVLLPFRLDALPSDLRVVRAQTSNVEQPGAEIDLGFANQPGCPSGTACAAQLTVGVSAGGAHGGPPSLPPPIQINGHKAYVTSGRNPYLTMQVDSWYVFIATPTGSRSATRHDLIDIAKHMTFAASATDTSTWFVAGQ